MNIFKYGMELHFQDMGVIPEDYFFKNMDTDHISIKRYILYDEKLSDGVAIMAYDICMRMKEEEVTGVSIECVVDSRPEHFML